MEPAPPPILELRNLSVSYCSASGNIPAVRGVSLQLMMGETLALVGETGSGKSTIALAAMRLLEDHEQTGDIFYRGREIQSIPAAEWRKISNREIGFIFQNMASALNPVLSPAAHLAETLRAHTKLAPGAAKKKALELLREAGIGVDQAGLYPMELSGGACQRIGIALAVCNEPLLVIADEPTSSIDPALQWQALEMLQRTQRRCGMALLLISHDLSLISRVSGRIAVMYHGRIVELGQKDEVLSTPAHPYTESLLRCHPTMSHHHVEKPLPAIPGSIPGAGELFAGCAFAPRCSRVERRCGEAVPALKHLSATHSVACVHGNTPGSGEL